MSRAWPLLWLLAAVAVAQSADPGATELAERVLAVVDEDPILESELEQVIGLGLAERRPDESEADFRRRLLDGLVDQKLRFHEIDRYGFVEVPLDQVDEQYAELQRRMGGAAALERALGRLDLDAEGLRQLLARQVMVLIYVEERLGPRVLIGLDDIQRYYEETLEPAMRERGRPAPPVAEVRESIRQLLREQRLNDEIEVWTDELRLEADIEDYLDSAHEQLPSQVIERRESG